MKELVWHRQLLPAIDRRPDAPFLTDASTGTTTTYGEHGTRVIDEEVREVGATTPETHADRRTRPAHIWRCHRW